MRSSRLKLAVPESATLLERALADGESAGRQIAHLLQRLDRDDTSAIRGVAHEAPEHNTPRAASVSPYQGKNYSEANFALASWPPTKNPAARYSGVLSETAFSR